MANAVAGSALGQTVTWDGVVVGTVQAINGATLTLSANVNALNTTGADHTLAVDCNVRDSHLTHSKYAALRTKDAICDQFLERCGRRPSVDVEEPMIGLNLHVYRDQAVLSLDSSGTSLAVPM